MKILQLSCILGFGPTLGLASILCMSAIGPEMAEKKSDISSAPVPSPQVQGGKKAESKSLPLDSIYTTSSQKGMIRIPGKNHKQLESTFEDLYRDMRGVGASNIFLAQADDISDAVLASWEVYIAWQSCDTPARTTQSKKSDKFWLVAYLGIATSNAPAWVVNEVEMNDKTVRLKYKKGGKSTVTDRRQYHIWAPLGTLPPGSYLLELFDEDQGQIALSRRVTIAGKKAER